jgi:hypothetical protein
VISLSDDVTVNILKLCVAFKPWKTLPVSLCKPVPVASWFGLNQDDEKVEQHRKFGGQSRAGHSIDFWCM